MKLTEWAKNVCSRGMRLILYYVPTFTTFHVSLGFLLNVLLYSILSKIAFKQDTIIDSIWIGHSIILLLFLTDSIIDLITCKQKLKRKTDSCNDRKQFQIKLFLQMDRTEVSAHFRGYFSLFYYLLIFILNEKIVKKNTETVIVIKIDI